MKCPTCGSKNIQDVSANHSGNTLLIESVCENCANFFTTTNRDTFELHKFQFYGYIAFTLIIDFFVLSCLTLFDGVKRYYNVLFKKL